MDLRTARYFRAKSQNDLERETGVFQSKVSRFERSGIQCLREDEKQKIEAALGLKIDWDYQEPNGAEKVTQEELDEIKPFIELLVSKEPLKTVEWLAGFQTLRGVYEAVKELMDKVVIAIPPQKMQWPKH